MPRENGDHTQEPAFKYPDTNSYTSARARASASATCAAAATGTGDWLAPTAVITAVYYRYSAEPLYNTGMTMTRTRSTRG